MLLVALYIMIHSNGLTHARHSNSKIKKKHIFNTLTFTKAYLWPLYPGNLPPPHPLPPRTLKKDL